MVPSKMYWTTFCAEKNLLVLPKLLKITLNIIKNADQFGSVQFGDIISSVMSGGAISEGDVAVSESTCECNFHSCMSLPCRHIFFFRKHKNMSSQLSSDPQRR
jgi:hypothetical protein